MPRFVLLFHECPPNYGRPSHWDFMIEVGPALWTWALSELPNAWQAAYKKTASSHLNDPPLTRGDGVEALQLAEHRLAYLEFEGPLSGDRGSVVQIDKGTYRMLNANDRPPANLQIELTGHLLLGVVTLAQSENDVDRWHLNAGATTNDL